jgi:hypothetical protein
MEGLFLKHKLNPETRPNKKLTQKKRRYAAYIAVFGNFRAIQSPCQEIPEWFEPAIKR